MVMLNSDIENDAEKLLAVFLEVDVKEISFATSAPCTCSIKVLIVDKHLHDSSH